VASHDVWCRWLARETRSQVISVGYRLAPEFPAPVPQEDAYSATAWIAARNDASERRVPLVVAGDSSGAGLAASVALMARDRSGPQIDAQVLIHPMLDDRATRVIEEKLPFLTWSENDNSTAWDALLGRDAGTDDVSPYAAPARMQDLSKLPKTYIEICELDLFFSEGVNFLSRLANADIQVEAHLLPGVPHAFDVLAPEAGVSQRMLAARSAFIKSVV
jgi:acetyl esterase/lipase